MRCGVPPALLEMLCLLSEARVQDPETQVLQHHQKHPDRIHHALPPQGYLTGGVGHRTYQSTRCSLRGASICTLREIPKITLLLNYSVVMYAHSINWKEYVATKFCGRENNVRMALSLPLKTGTC